MRERERDLRLTDNCEKWRPSGWVLDEQDGYIEAHEKAVLENILEHETTRRHDQQHNAQVEYATVVGVAAGRAEQRVANFVVSFQIRILVWK